MMELRYPGRRFMRDAVRAIRYHDSFAINLNSSRRRKRLLRMLPALEADDSELSWLQMGILFFGLFRFMSVYFAAKGTGYTVTHDGSTSIRFVHDSNA